MIDTLDECIRLARSYPVPNLLTVSLKQFEIQLYLESQYHFRSWEWYREKSILRTETWLKANYPVINPNYKGLTEQEKKMFKKDIVDSLEDGAI